ncbi:MAG TPA: copper chaperone PCu(A)C [Halomonas sp.]|nr:copper chaperone PCu(A)C [Halomonas sp.]
MRVRHLARALLCSTLLSPLALAEPATPVGLQIDNAFARPTPPGATSAGAYADIRATGETVTLTGAHSPASDAVELHVMRMEGDTMLMRPVKSIDISADSPLTMRPGGGYHLMLIDLDSPLVEGRSFPITLEFDGRDDVEVEFDVEPMDGMSGAMDHAEH